MLYLFAHVELYEVGHVRGNFARLGAELLVVESVDTLQRIAITKQNKTM
jgi:hypothetical protein